MSHYINDIRKESLVEMKIQRILYSQLTITVLQLLIIPLNLDVFK